MSASFRRLFMNEKEIINADVKYEAEDVSGKWLGAIGVFIIIAAIILPFLLWGLYGSFKKIGTSVSEADSRQKFAVPPEPNLQPNPVVNYQKFRRAENEKLNDYGWVNRDKGIVRIPIEEAMRKLVNEGLPEIKSSRDNTNSAQNNAPTTNVNAANQQMKKER